MEVEEGGEEEDVVVVQQVAGAAGRHLAALGRWQEMRQPRMLVLTSCFLSLSLGQRDIDKGVVWYSLALLFS